MPAVTAASMLSTCTLCGCIGVKKCFTKLPGSSEQHCTTCSLTVKVLAAEICQQASEMMTPDEMDAEYSFAAGLPQNVIIAAMQAMKMTDSQISTYCESKLARLAWNRAQYFDFRCNTY